MTTRPSNPKPKEKKQPDFARGQRQQTPPAGGADYARGERKLPPSADEQKHPDFAEGQRDLPKPAGEHPDFARGQDGDQAGDEPEDIKD